jgi:Flp pilus assembly protein TadG
MWVTSSRAQLAHLSRRDRRNRRGVTILLAGLAMLALIGIVSLAVDLGRVRSCHDQLQNGADAAALGAAVELPSIDFSYINGVATDVAGKNVAGELAIDVRDADIEYGEWNLANRTFTVLSGDDRNGANAIRVTAQRLAARNNALPLYLARAVGVDHSDIRTIATAYIHGGQRGFGIVGINWVNLNGTTYTDSYNADAGPYDPLHHNYNGTIASNGDITDVGTIDVWGDARPGVDHIVTDPSLIHGWAGSLDAPLVYPPATVPPGTQPGSPDPFKLVGNKTLPIPGGSWLFSSITTGGNTTLQFPGPGVTKIYVTGDIKIDGSVTFNSTLPSNVQIFKIGPGTVDLGGNSNWFAQVYAPEADVTFHGLSPGGGFYGSMIGWTLTVDGNSQIHYDESVNPQLLKTRAVLVQ